jgi:hypothetical protein
MKANQMVGVIALVLGATLLGYAYQSSHAALQQISGSLAGHVSNQTLWYLLGGTGITLGGGLLAIFGRRL